MARDSSMVSYGRPIYFSSNWGPVKAQYRFAEKSDNKQNKIHSIPALN